MARKEYVVVDIVDILRRHQKGDGIRSIVRATGMSRNTVKKYLPDVDKVKVIPVNWPALNLSDIRKAQNDFRKVLNVD